MMAYVKGREKFEQTSAAHDTCLYALRPIERTRDIKRPPDMLGDQEFRGGMYET